MRAILTKRLTFRGFIVSDFAARYRDFMRDVSVWVGEGRIKHREDVVEGLENAPRALIGLLRGRISANFWCKLHLRPCNKLRNGVAGIGPTVLQGLALRSKSISLAAGSLGITGVGLF
jgi:hypothetical protein